MLDLISKFPQLERPKNVLNDLKRYLDTLTFRNKEEVEIENAIVKSMTRRANKISSKSTLFQNFFEDFKN